MRTNPPRPVTVDRSPPEPLTPTELRSWMSEQTVFISSVMKDMAAEREAARNAVESLGGKVLMFDRLGGRDDDARTAYLTGVQSSDTYVGILGARYGKPDPTGYFPTHMKYNEAVRVGLRPIVWATTGEMDGRQRGLPRRGSHIPHNWQLLYPQALGAPPRRHGLSDRIAVVQGRPSPSAGSPLRGRWDPHQGEGFDPRRQRSCRTGTPTA